MVECDKIIGLAVGSKENDWDGQICFAQQREQINKTSRAKDKSKRRVASELHVLKSSVNYDRGAV